MPFPRPCDRCGKKFKPTSKSCRLCDECYYKRHEERLNKIRNLKRK